MPILRSLLSQPAPSAAADDDAAAKGEMSFQEVERNKLTGLTSQDLPGLHAQQPLVHALPHALNYVASAQPLILPMAPPMAPPRMPPRMPPRIVGPQDLPGFRREQPLAHALPRALPHALNYVTSAQPLIPPRTPPRMAGRVGIIGSPPPLTGGKHQGERKSHAAGRGVSRHFS